MTPETTDPIAPAVQPSPPSRRSLSISVSTVVWSVSTVALATVAIVLAVLLIGARSDIADRDVAAADTVHAEQVATDYAVGAATVKFDDFDAWVARLKANTSPALANKFDATAPKLEQILTPLQWVSTANPIAAKVKSEAGGIYTVDVFVNVTSSNAQNHDGAQTTVTYNITVDGNADWKITDVGGMDAALPVR